MCKRVCFLGFCLVLFNQVGFARNNIGIKTFIPGLVQWQNNEMIKFYGIAGTEAISLVAGAICWYWSDSEYDKYKELPKIATQTEFDKHLHDSEFYGTVAIGSFAIFGATYIYSVIDAIWLSGGKGKYGLYLEPKREGVSLCAVINF